MKARDELIYTPDITHPCMVLLIDDPEHTIHIHVHIILTSVQCL